MPQINNALVTGGAGFIGSNLVDALLEQGTHVKVLDNLSTGRIENLDHVMDDIEFIEGDIRDLATLEKLVQGCDVVFHQAAVVSVPLTVEDPIFSAQVNDIGTLNVLEAAKKANVKRVVLASSCAVYGDDPALPKTEGMPIKPQTPYAIQKYTNELNAGIYASLYNLETVCLRYFNVFGPRQDPSSPYSGVISIFMNKALNKEKPVIYGDGTQFRDFVFVKDVVNANLLAATAKTPENQVLNIGTGHSITVNDLWSSISTLAECSIEPQYELPRAGDIFGSLADVTRAKELLGYEPRFAFDEGLLLTNEWYLHS
jgi:nucleoside-diphosphate-sugar epimerase